MKGSARILGVALIALLASGCSMFVEENRRTLNHLDENWAPRSTTGRWLTAPVALPVGLVALVADAVIVHPHTVIDDAWGDTVELLWEPRDESRFRRAVMFPLVTIATPIVFLGDFLGRAILPIDPREESGS